MRKLSIIVSLVILGIVIVAFATDILFLLIPFIGHTSEYGSKASAFFMALTAFITLLLASATFQSTEQMNLREQQQRNDAIEKENRDRKERWLDDILNWSANFKSPTLGGGISFSTLIGKELIGAFDIVSGDMLSKSEYIKYSSDALDEHLNTSVKNAISKLEICSKACKDFLISPDDAIDLEPKSKHFVRCKIDIEKSANEVIQIASKLKISLLP